MPVIQVTSLALIFEKRVNRIHGGASQKHFSLVYGAVYIGSGDQDVAAGLGNPIHLLERGHRGVRQMFHDFTAEHQIKGIIFIRKRIRFDVQD